MRRSARWTAALAVGLAVGAGTHHLADWPSLAVANAVGYVVAVGLLLRLHYALKPNVASWNDATAARWSGLLGLTVGATGTVVDVTLGLPTWESAAVTAFVYAVAGIGMATGIGTTLAYLEHPTSPPSPPTSSRDDDPTRGQPERS